MTSVAAPPDQESTRDDAAAERLYAEYSDAILAYCLRRLGSRSDAEDAAQLTFLYALRALRRGVVPESESAWLYAIARNVCRWQQRTAARRPVSGDRGLESVASPEPDDESELLGELREALESMPERQRHALLLREWRGLSAAEIGHHLDLSAPATHALLTRARRTLAHALTAPRRAALGLASAAYELRDWLKAALGGASAKAAVATVAVVGAGVAGVAADQRIGGDGSSPQPVESTPATAFDLGRGRGQDPGAETAGSAQPGTSPAGDAGAGIDGAGPTISRAGPAAADGDTSVFRRPRVGGAPAPGGGSSPSPTDPRGPAVPELGLPALPLGPPAPPSVDLPAVDLPAIDVPPLDLPPIDAPTDLVPPLDLPPVDLPPVDVAPLDLSPVDLPPAPPLPTLPGLP